MKKIFNIFSALLLHDICFSSVCLAQSDVRNYVVKHVMQDEEGKHSVTTVEYYDGLGRKEQVVNDGVVPGSASHSLLSRTLYDGAGREGMKFLPVSVSGLDYQSNLLYKYDDKQALFVTSYDALNRPISVSTPGSDMGEHSKKYYHWANEANTVKRYIVSADGDLLLDGYYSEGELMWERMVDEDSNVTDIYTDILGQKVLERHALGKGTADTYFVYNDCNRLCYVLQPMYQLEENLDRYAFRYHYNERGLVSEKTIPGCDKITYTYDQADRLLAMQDGEMRKKGVVLHHAYDGLGRLKTRTLNFGKATTRAEQEIFYDGNYSFLNVYENALTSGNKNVLVYSGQMGMTSAQNHDFGKSFVCGSIMRSSDGSPIFTAIYYDRKGRVVEKNSKLLGSHFRREQFTYTFIGKLLTHTVVDYEQDKEVLHSVTTNNYDTATGLLTSKDVSISVGGASYVNRRVANYEYDEYGRISSITHGSVAQTTIYDVRDWPIELSSSNFTEELTYTPVNYNGKVSSIHYVGPSYDYYYDFGYDSLDRLTDCNYYNYRDAEEAWATPDFCEYADYDSNGNIISLRRTGFPDERVECRFIDDLLLSYDGNQLKGVVDKEGDHTYMTTTNFIQNGNGESDYTYNANGALQSDANKYIAFVEYDTYGYPKSIYFRNGSIISYVHTPDGQKLQVSYTIPVSHINKPYGAPFTLSPSEIQSVTKRDYWGDDIICKNGVPEMFFFNGGFADINNQTFSWHYYVEDHLGNKRIVQDEQGKVESTYNYYPFGIIFDHWAELYAQSKHQPFKFNGKELYNMFDFYAYDFGARLYNPLIGRWLGIDPQCEKYYNWSPYAFCADNPINIIDPNGEELFLAGSFDQRMEILGVLQMLTNDNLLMNRKTGKVTLSGKPRWDKRDKNLAVGTALIRDIINDKHTLTIRVWDGDNMEIPISSHDVKQKGVGSDALISFNPKRRTSLGVAEENGNCEEFVNLPRFALGHELVHGIRDMKGHTASMIATPYKFKNFKGKYVEKRAPKEELITTGIIGNYKYTDNKIRLEQGCLRRVMY